MKNILENLFSLKNYLLDETEHISLLEKINELEERIIKLEDESISQTNELYRLENSLESRIDILAEQINN